MTAVKSDLAGLRKKQPDLIHSENRKVLSHVQRQEQEWIIHTLMLDGISVPFRFKRKRFYSSLQGCRVNLSYYPTFERVADMQLEVMKVVRIRRS